MQRFIWDYDNLAHIAEHGVSAEEVEYALNGLTLPLDYQDWHIEERFAEIGVTANGRFLTVVTTMRGDYIRVVTAYDSSKSEIRAYLKERGTSWRRE